MSFSILFELVQQFYDESDIIELDDVYNRFFTSEGNKVINVNYALKNWLDEVAELYDIPDNYFRKAWIKDCLSDYDQREQLLHHIRQCKFDFVDEESAE